MTSPQNTSPATAIELAEIVFPQHANHYGTLFAGQALLLMTKAAFLCARGYAQSEVVMARVGDAQFLAPVLQGSVLRLRAWVSRVGRTSMTVCVNGLAEQAPGMPQELAVQGIFEMVAVDGNGRPAPIDHAYLHKETQ